MSPFDPIEEARKRREAERKRSEVEAAYEDLYGSAFDPIAAAKKRLAQEQQLAQIEAEYVKLAGPPPPFDPVAEAKKRLEREKQRAAIEAEYAKLVPPKPTVLEPAFDPVVEAKKRREKQRQDAQIRASYEEMYGVEESKTRLDRILAIAQQFRGTIGGFAGTLVGASLDALNAFRRAQVDIGRKRREAELLEEARTPQVLQIPSVQPVSQGTGVQMVHGPRSPGPPTVTPVPPMVGPPGSPGLAPAAGGAGAGAGAMAGAAGAIPIVGLAIMARELVKQLGQAAVGAIGSAGRYASGMIDPSTDPSAAITRIGSAAKEAGESLAQVSPVVGYMIAAVGEATKSLGALIRNIDGMVERYGEFSPLIAQQQAIIEVRSTLGDIRRSREAERGLVQYMQARGELVARFEDIKIRLLNRLLEVVTPMLIIMNKVVQGAESMGGIINAGLSPLTDIAGAMTQLVGMQRDDRMPRPSELDPTNVILNIPGGQSTGFGQLP